MEPLDLSTVAAHITKHPGKISLDSWLVDPYLRENSEGIEPIMVSCRWMNAKVCCLMDAVQHRVATVA